jgi:curli biogenesis system outer membrane secretion channel CsgG
MKKMFGLFLILVSASQGAVAQGLSNLLDGNDFSVNSISAPSMYLENIKKIAVLNFLDENLETAGSSGNPNEKRTSVNYGKRMADYIVTNLTRPAFGLNPKEPLYIQGFRTNLFTVVERSQLEPILKEQNLGVSGALSDSEASQAGKLLGIDIIILGSVSVASNDREGSAVEDKKGAKLATKLVNKVSDDDVKTGFKITRTVTTRTNVRFIRVETGEVLNSINIEKIETDSKFDDVKIPPASFLLPVSQLADRGFTQAAAEIMRFVSPAYSHQSLEILKIKKEFKDKAKEAADYIQEGRIDKALMVYTSIYEQDPYSIEIANNLGVLYEGTGNYEKALEFYKISAELGPENKLFQAAVARTESSLVLKKFLESYDIIIKPYEFSEAGSGSSKLADRIQTKGNTKDRYEVRDGAQATAAVVVKVPGGTSFDVIEKLDGWYKIKLLGGKTGFIAMDAIKN